MITEADLKQAIAECQAERNPNAHTCVKLAAFYTLLDHLTEDTEDIPNIYSYDAGPAYGPSSTMINFPGQSEFAEAIHGKPIEDVLPVIEELMDTVKILQPRLYSGAIRKLLES